MGGVQRQGVVLEGVRARRRAVAWMAAGCLAAFLVVTALVVGRAGNTLDHRVLQASPGMDWYWSRWLVRVRQLGAPHRALPLAVVLAVTGLAWPRTRRATAVAGAVFVGGVLVSTLLKYGFGQSGPPVVDGPPVDNGTAFPSGHTVIASLLYPCVAAVLAGVTPRRLTPVLVAGAVGVPVAVGLCQVLVRTHWLSDVVAAWLFSVVWLCLASLALERFAGPRRTGRASSSVWGSGRVGAGDL